jgi:hypothetical protein
MWLKSEINMFMWRNSTHCYNILYQYQSLSLLQVVIAYSSICKSLDIISRFQLRTNIFLSYTSPNSIHEFELYHLFLIVHTYIV